MSPSFWAVVAGLAASCVTARETLPARPGDQGVAIEVPEGNVQSASLAQTHWSRGRTANYFDIDPARPRAPATRLSFWVKVAFGVAVLLCTVLVGTASTDLPGAAAPLLAWPCAARWTCVAAPLLLLIGFVAPDPASGLTAVFSAIAKNTPILPSSDGQQQAQEDQVCVLARFMGFGRNSLNGAYAVNRTRLIGKRATYWGGQSGKSYLYWCAKQQYWMIDGVMGWERVLAGECLGWTYTTGSDPEDFVRSQAWWEPSDVSKGGWAKTEGVQVTCEARDGPGLLWET